MELEPPAELPEPRGASKGPPRSVMPCVGQHFISDQKVSKEFPQIYRTIMELIFPYWSRLGCLVGNILVNQNILQGGSQGFKHYLVACYTGVVLGSQYWGQILFSSFANHLDDGMDTPDLQMTPGTAALQKDLDNLKESIDLNFKVKQTPSAASGMG
ncbi:hypothetical protein WISP_136443 [Willisornis vidua]|uniref:Uncharacterized protein n=1 Tax=Willisornis vidua TaxID=1566151 RepID=A0ABQ9CTW0_9PASS|nr:hypothetical protein WISP_136443 [Willisornis vidua]